MGLHDFTTKEIFNKVFRSASGGTVALQSSTTQERLNAVLDDSNDALRVSMSGAKIYATFVHNFADDIGTTAHFLPWSDETEGTGSGRWFYPMPFSSMKCVKVIMRTRALSDHNGIITLTIGTINDQDAVGATAFNANASVNQALQVSANDNSSIVYDTFNNPAVFTHNVQAGGIKMLGMKIQANVDVGSSNEWYFTSLWECEV